MPYAPACWRRLRGSAIIADRMCDRWHDATPKGLDMDLYEVLDRVVELLRRRKRVTYRLLQRQFSLDAATLEDLKTELLFAHPQVQEEGDVGLVWTDDVDMPGPPPSPPASPSAAQEVPAVHALTLPAAPPTP